MALILQGPQKYDNLHLNVAAASQRRQTHTN